MDLEYAFGSMSESKFLILPSDVTEQRAYQIALLSTFLG